MSAFSEKKIKLDDSVSNFEENIKKTFSLLLWDYKQLSDGIYEAKIGFGLRSYGERFTLKYDKVNSTIFLKSQCVFPQIFDFGKNSSNIEEFEKALDKILIAKRPETKTISKNPDQDISYIEKLKKVRKLHILEIVNEIEFNQMKQKILKEMLETNTSSQEDLLISILPLVEQNILLKEDIELIKNLTK